MSLQIFEDLEQGTDEWLAARCGILTASVVGKLITPKTMKLAANDTSRGLICEIVAERITGHVEYVHPSFDMQRGTMDEPYARDAYAEHMGVTVAEVGFMVRTLDGHRLGYSPDGLVGDDGLIEIKSRKPKIQLRTILEDAVPAENMAQIQTGLLVSGREWVDYVSYCGGMPLYVKRVTPDPAWQALIREALVMVEAQATTIITAYEAKTKGLPVPERIDHYLEAEISL